MGQLGLGVFVLCCFAGNSLLARAALGSGGSDWAAFAAVRVASGAAVLVGICVWRKRDWRPGRGDWGGIAALLGYLWGFTWAYRELGAATGALVLFAFVQLTIAAAKVGSLRWREGMGMLVAMGGLVWLLAPGVARPPLAGSVAMALAGVAWGVYTLLGRGEADAMGRTARNFVGAAVVSVLLVSVFLVPVLAAPEWGTGWALDWALGLAVVSGAITSALGYVAWYRWLKHLSAAMAGVVQLLTPVVAAAGAGVLLGEALPGRLWVATGLILGGMALALPGSKR